MKTNFILLKSSWPMRATFFSIIFLFFTATNLTQGQTVATDKTDYAPGDYVTITGSGWQVGEMVACVIKHTIFTTHPDQFVNILADGYGNIRNATYQIATTDVGEIFLLTATGQTSGKSASIEFTDTPSANPTSITASNTTVCEGATVTLTEIGGILQAHDTYVWYNALDCGGSSVQNATSITYSVTLNTAGTYTFSVKNSTLGCGANITITVKALPTTPTITAGGPITFCAGGSVVLTSSSATGNQWYLAGSPITNATSQTYTASAAGSYTVVVTTDGCSSAASAATMVSVNNITPGVIAKGAVQPGPGCDNLDPGITAINTVATGSGSLSYIWQQSTDNINWVSALGEPNTSGTQFNPAQFSITTSFKRIATSTLNSVSCSAESNVLTYVVNASPTVASITSAGALLDICVGSTLQLSDATPGGVWSSSNPSIASVDLLTGLVTGVSAGNLNLGIHYTVTNEFGCSTTRNKTVNVIALPTGTLSNNGPVCSGDNALLTFTKTTGTGPFDLVINGTTYPGITSGGTISVTPSATSTTYTLTSITDKGITPSCPNTVNVSTTITVNALPTGTLSNNGPVCSGENAFLTFTKTTGTGPFDLVINGTTYSGIADGGTISVTPSTPSTIYTLTSITDKGVTPGCPNTVNVSTTVTVNTLPTMGSVTVNNPVVCFGSSVIFSADGLINGTTDFVYSLTIDGGTAIQANANGIDVTDGTASFTVPEPDPGVYNVEIVSATINGCTSHFTGKSATFTVKPNPTLTGVAILAPEVCFGSTVNVTASGLLNGSTLFYYTVAIDRGTANLASVTKTVSGDGTTFTFSTPDPGKYDFVLVSATINGCETDFTANNSVSFTVVPDPTISITGGTAICTGSSATLSAITGNGTGTKTIQWQTSNGTDWIDIAGQNETTLTVSPTATTSYRATYSASGNECTTAISNTQTITVNELPTCSISGADGPLCPSSTGNTYTAIEGMSTYVWSITGNATIVGSTSSQTVSLSAGAGCGESFTLSVTITDGNGCSSTCEKTVNVDDTENPVLTVPSTGLDLTCNPVTLPTEASVVAASSATDNCGTPVITAVAGLVNGDCSKSQTFTVTATDGCNNTDVKTVTYTWSDDTEAPTVATAQGADSNIGCNPDAAAIEAAFVAPVFEDGCGTPTVDVVNAHKGTGCLQSDTRTWTATDGCGNHASVSQVISYTIDILAPTVLTAQGDDANIGCNPSATAIEAAFVAPVFEDDCSTPSVEVATVHSGTGCLQSDIRTWTASDACSGLTKSVSQTISYTIDTEAPMIACNPTITLTAPNGSCAYSGYIPTTPTASDNCTNSANLVVSGVRGDALALSDPYPVGSTEITWSTTDACGNPGTCVTTVNVNTTAVHNVTQDTWYCKIQDAINAANSGDAINIYAGTYVETGQIVITKNLTIVGADKATTIIKPDQDFTSGGWISVNSGIEFNLSKVTLDGTGHNISNAILHQGSGTIMDCALTEIMNPWSSPASGRIYEGTAIKIVSTGNVDVTGCSFTQIGRNGIRAQQNMGTINGNHYTGKGFGDWMDYFILSEYGDHIVISGNTVTNCLGAALSDGSTSSAIAVWDDPGTQANITGNTLTGNTTGVAVVAATGGTTDPKVIVGAANIIDGGQYGFAIQSWGVAYNPDVTFTGTSTFKGQTVAAFSIDENILPGSKIDISSAEFQTSGGTPIADNFTKEDLVIHVIDAPNRGLFVWNTNNVYVTPNSFISPSTTAASIQRGVDAASSGWTVNVAAGTYYESQVLIGKALTVNGAGLFSTIIDGGNAALATSGLVRITADGNVSFNGFTIQHAGGPAQTDGGGDGKLNVGIYAQSGLSSAIYTLSNNKIVGTNNAGDEEDYGFYSHSGKEDLVFTNNEITQTGANAVLLEKHDGVVDVSNNTLNAGAFGTDAIFDMTYGGIDISALHKFNGNTIDLSTGSGGGNASGVTIASSFQSTINGNGKFTNVQITNNTITGMIANRRGINLWNGAPDAGTAGDINNPVITGNSISGIGASTLNCRGIQLINLISDAVIEHNAIDLVNQCIRGFSYAPGTGIATGTGIHDNSFSHFTELNWAGATELDASCNWWGTANASAIASKISGNVSYPTWYSSEADSDPGPGFTPTGTCNGSPVSLVSAVSDPFICGNTTGSITISWSGGTSAYSLSWTGGGSVSDIAGSPYTIHDLNPGIYTVTVTDANGSSATSNDATITVNPRPLAEISGTTTICNGTSANLSIAFTGTAPFTYSINGQASVIATANPEIVSVSPTSNSTYTITSLTDANCTAIAGGMTGSAEVTVLPNPTIGGVTVTTASPICFGSAVYFEATGLINGLTLFNYTVDYNGTGPVAGSQTIDVTDGTATFSHPEPNPGNYEIVIVSATVNGCTTTFGANNTTSFTVNPNPTLSGLITNATSPVCYGTTISFTASGLLDGINTFDYSISGTGPGLPINNQIATVSVTGGSFTFPAPAHPYAVGDYLVKINSITVNGCTTTFSTGNTVSFTVKSNPTISGVTVSAASVCFGSPETFTANGLLDGITDFVYSVAIDGGIPVEGSAPGVPVSGGTATFPVPEPNVGTYAIKIISATVNGCTTVFEANNTASFTVYPIPTAPTVDVVDNHNGTSTLTASDFTGTLLWSTNENSTSITVNTGGVYTVTQTVNGCTSPPGSGTVVQTPNTTIQAPAQVSCGVYKVDVTVQDFTNVGAISMKLNYDPLVVAYQSADINPAIHESFDNGNNTTGQFSFSYSGSGITLPKDAILLTLHFSVLTTVVSETNTPLTWSRVSPDCEYAGPGGVPVYFSTFDDKTITVNTCSISGTLKYNNTAQTPMNLVELTLSPGNAKVTTDVDGKYSFTGLHDGVYSIAVTDNKKDVGYINSTDAGAANLWGTSGGDIEYVKFQAGDVAQNNLYINNLDALRIQKFFVNGLAFDKAPWVYWKKGVAINNNYMDPKPANFDVTLSGENVTGYDLFGMCTGDFNGSFTPTKLKSASSSLRLTSAGNMQVGANQKFELPFRAGTSMEVGAVSMILRIPSGLVNVQDVLVNGSAVAADWAVNGDELRIGWYSSMPVNAAANDNLLTLKLTTTETFTPGQSIDLALKFDPLNELADGNFNVVDRAILEVAKVGNLTVGVDEPTKYQDLSISNYPNPFRNSTTVAYSLPIDGKVTIIVYNELGQSVMTLIDGDQNAGKYTILMNSSMLRPGIYLAKLRLSHKNLDLVGTVKLSVHE